MCLTSMVRRTCRTCKSWMPMAWDHRLPDVPDHDSRVAGHATEWMSMLLWSNGYVLYSPSGPVIAVRYEGDKSNNCSDWVTNDKEAEAVQEKLRTLLRVLHSNQSVEKPPTSLENWRDSCQNPSAARNLISIADPDSLFLAGSGMPACRGKHGPGSCYSCTALQVPYSFSRGCPSPMVSAPPLSGRRRQRYERAKRVRFLRSTRTGCR